MSWQRGSATGWFVEARARELFGSDPPVVNGRSLSPLTWRRIEFDRQVAEGGVPNKLYNPLARERGLLAYPTALTLIAWCAAEYPETIEFRLVKMKLSFEWKIEREGVSEPIVYDYEASRAVETTPEEEDSDGS